MNNKQFSVQLESWLKSSGKKTFGDLEEVFGSKSFAVIVLILMLPSALPIPTGGITQVFELFTVIIALEMIAGRRTLWLPGFVKRKEIGHSLKTKALPKVLSFIRWFEKRSKPRLDSVLNNSWFLRVVGIAILIFALGAGLALPFSGLDTLPSMGAVLLSLALLLEDAVVFIVGLAVGTAGIIVELMLGSFALELFK